KKEIQRLRNLIKEKKIDFELYEDDIFTSYLMFISVRTRVKFLDSDKEVAFPLSGSFSTYSTLSKNMFNFETVKMNQLRAMDHKLRKVLMGFKSDTAFMGVYCFFWGSEVKPFYIIVILLINDKFLMGYMNPNEDLVDLIEVRMQQEFLKTMIQLYKNFNPKKESRWNNLGYDWKFIIQKLYEFGLFKCFYQTLYEKKPKNIKSVIRYHRVVEQVKISASKTATHYFMKTDGTVHYDMQTQLRQYFKTLQNWKLNDILKKMGLDPKKDLSIEEMYDIIIKCRNSKYNEGAKKKRCNLILSYCIRDCQGPKKIYEKMFKNIEYLLMSKLSYITVQEYSSGNKMKMINNLIVDFSYREKRNLSVGYLKSERPKKKFTGGFVRELKKKGFLMTLKAREHGREYHEVSFYDDLENKYTLYFDKNKKGLILVVLSSLVAQRKQAKRDRDYNKNNEFLYNYHNVLQTLFKELANSIYGQFWSKPSFFRNYMISSSVTAFGRDYLVKVSDFAENNSLEGFLKIFFKIVNDMVTESYKRYEEFEREINSWIDSNYYFDNNWIGVEDYYKKKYGTWGNEDVIDEFIRNTDENILLTCCKKIQESLKLIYTMFDLDKYGEYLYDLKFTKIEQYFDFINGFDQENIWMKHVCLKLTEEFISYLYKRETELSMKLFEMTGRNNIEDDDEEISLIEIVETDAFKKNNWKYTDGKIILYEKNRELDFSLVRNIKKEDYDSDPQDEDEEDFEESEDEDES
ncbi:34315_t:CDS:2, partial [Gigaspora margarita]